MKIMDMCGNTLNLELKDTKLLDVKPLVAIHSLSYRFRFWGNIPQTVSLHSVILSNYFLSKGNKINAKWALIHELFEAYTGDIPTPIKKEIPQYKDIENKFLSQYAEICNLPFEMPNEVHKADKQIMIDEAIQYMPNKNYWLMINKPLNISINVVSPLESKVMMARMWKELELPDPNNQILNYLKKTNSFRFKTMLFLSKIGFWAERKVWKCT